MDKLKKNIKTLEILSYCDKTNRNKILSSANQDLILCICECVLNSLNGNIKLDKKIVHKLKKYKHTLRKVTNGLTANIVYIPPVSLPPFPPSPSLA